LSVAVVVVPASRTLPAVVVPVSVAVRGLIRPYFGVKTTLLDETDWPCAMVTLERLAEPLLEVNVTVMSAPRLMTGVPAASVKTTCEVNEPVPPPSLRQP
jgi:hypothetical protein